MSFYKNDNESLLEAPNFVLNSEYELRKESYQEYNLPVDGWYWFDTIEEAYAEFGIEAPVEETEEEGVP